MKTAIEFVVADTSIWLEYFLAGSQADKFSALLREPELLLVPTIIIYEVFKKVLASKHQDAAVAAVRGMISSEVIPLDDVIAVRAAKFSHVNRIPMADSIIYVTAQKNNATLWTMDTNLKGLDGVKYFGKK